MSTRSNSTSDFIKKFQPISLSEMDNVRLMHRVDTKFVFNKKLLNAILEKAKENYKMVEISNTREQPYKTTYFDTPVYSMYTAHHNGKRNRYKVRIRTYENTQHQFLEVKFKNNKGETLKRRISQNVTGMERMQLSDSFITENTPFLKSDLQPSLENSFTRLTLVNKAKSERITLDYNLWFRDVKEDNELFNSQLCIAEVKRDKTNLRSDFITLLAESGISRMGFSKYCIGLAMLNNKLKTNLFRERIRSIDKLIEFS